MVFDGHYEDWRHKRIETLKKYLGESYFKNKTLLEVGCGYADIGHEMSMMGAIVTSCDARQEHLDVVKEKYPTLQTFLYDADKDELTQKYDILLHWGLLYHLKDVRNHLMSISKWCDVLLLESEVCDSEDPDLVIVTKEAGVDQAYNEVGSRPSALYIEKILEQEGFRFQQIRDSSLNSSFHIYDWDVKHTNTWINGLRRFWICWKGQCPLRL